MFKGEAKSESAPKIENTARALSAIVTQPTQQCDWSIAYQDNNLISFLFLVFIVM